MLLVATGGRRADSVSDSEADEYSDITEETDPLAGSGDEGTDQEVEQELPAAAAAAEKAAAEAASLREAVEWIAGNHRGGVRVLATYISPVAQCWSDKLKLTYNCFLPAAQHSTAQHRYHGTQSHPEYQPASAGCVASHLCTVQVCLHQVLPLWGPFVCLQRTAAT